MNIILFERAELELPLQREDRRAIHLLDVLRRREGDTFDAGLIDGPRGKGTVIAISNAGLSLSFRWGDEPPAMDAITVIIGLPRPQTARALLRELTSMGIAVFHFVTTEKGDPNYASSSLWHSGEWRRHLVAGAEQAFCTRLPQVAFGRSLTETVAQLPNDAPTQRFALDNYEGTSSLSQINCAASNVTLAVGSERGWSEGERNLLRRSAFTLVHLGPRVLRTETASIAALVLLKARQGSL